MNSRFQIIEMVLPDGTAFDSRIRARDRVTRAVHLLHYEPDPVPPIDISIPLNILLSPVKMSGNHSNRTSHRHPRAPR
jgi:hypothetical protein